MSEETAPVSWWIRANERLKEHSNQLFVAWLQTKEGKKWMKKPEARRGSPYAAGFSLPEYCCEIVDALGKNDEERVKGLVMQHIIGLPTG